MARGKFSCGGSKDHGVALYRLALCRCIVIPAETLKKYRCETEAPMKAIQIGMAIALLMGAFLLAMQMSRGEFIGDREKKATQEMNSELDKAIAAHRDYISRRARGWRGIP